MALPRSCTFSLVRYGSCFRGVMRHSWIDRATNRAAVLCCRGTFVLLDFSKLLVGRAFFDVQLAQDAETFTFIFRSQQIDGLTVACLVSVW
jgi:hypothetical protein